MVETARGPAGLNPKISDKKHIPNVRWWRFTKRNMWKQDLDYILRRTYYPNHKSIQPNMRNIKFAKNKRIKSNIPSTTTQDLSKQIEKVKTLRAMEKKIKIMVQNNSYTKTAPVKGYTFGNTPRFK